MERFVSRYVVVVLLTLAVAALVTQAQAQPKAPPDFTFTKSEGSPGQVTFSHQKHMTAADKCTVCHTKVFKMKKGTSGEFKMAKMDAGELCGSCHNGKTVIGGKTPFATNDGNACEKCHKP